MTRTAENMWSTIQDASGAMVTDEGLEMLAAMLGTTHFELLRLAEALVRVIPPTDDPAGPVAFGLQVGALLHSAKEMAE